MAIFFWVLMVFSFVAGAIHGRAVEQTDIIGLLSRYGKEHWPLLLRRKYELDESWPPLQ
jgi:hypothetical protein